MRKINRAIAIPGSLTSVACTTDMALTIADPTREAVKNIYRGLIIAPNGKRTYEVAVALMNLYDAKCAYCEKQCYDPEVEHFRPKGRVISANPNPHGYYWLAYEWTNLLPSCHECNTLGAKSDKFPIRGIRMLTHPLNGNPAVYDPTQNIFTSAVLHAEDPLFIHPEYCLDINSHIDFQVDGRMVGLTDEGKQTVADLKLDSDTLNGMRREIYKSYFNRLEKIILRFKSTANPKTEAWFEEEVGQFVNELVGASMDKDLQFTLFRESLVSKIGYFFVEPFPQAYHSELNIFIARGLTRLIV